MIQFTPKKELSIRLREAKGKGKRERYTQLNAEFHRIPRKDKKVFLNEQCKETEGNNRMAKTGDVSNKTDIKGTFHVRMENMRGQKA